MKFINTYKSSNYNNRALNADIDFIIIHYTATLSLRETIKLLCDNKSKVSSHFLISKKGSIYQLVDEKYRAWHAGISYWKKKRDINSFSIGIELQYSGKNSNFEQYPLAQIDSLMNLIQYLKKTNNILNINILGHSDIAPFRKKDPGENFPWYILEKNNLVYLPKIRKFKKVIEIDKFSIKFLRNNLSNIGYNLENNNKNTLKKVIKAFQMHYQQDFVTGFPNIGTHLLVNQYCKDWIDY